MVIVFRFLQGGVGSVGATLVGGTLADIWGAHERGGKMSVFSLMAVGGTSFAPVPMGFVEANPNLEWRWIQWIQAIFFAAYLPSVWFMQETRAAVLLRRQTARLTRQHRKDREAGKTDGRDVTYLTRADVNKPSMKELLKISMIRPIREWSQGNPKWHTPAHLYIPCVYRIPHYRTRRHLFHHLAHPGLVRHVRDDSIHDLCLSTHVQL